MFEWFAAALIISGVWVWIWTVACFILVLAFSENEKNFWAFVSIGAFIALMQHSAIISIFSNPLVLLGWAVAYFIIGGLWSFIKWFSFIHKRAELFGELKLKFIKELNERNIRGQVPDFVPLIADVKTIIPEILINNFQRYLSTFGTGFSSTASGGKLNVIPSAQNHKQKIVTWILWWPTSAVWTLLNDPLVRLAEWMHKRFQGLYKKIAERTFAKYGV